MDNLYICPVCFKKINKEVTLIKNEKSYTCLNNHSFDISKEGYINLLQINANNGDNETLIKAREQFLNKDYYKPLKDKLISILKDLKTEIEGILGIDHKCKIILMGAGNLGRAVATHMPFDELGFELIGIYDAAPLFTGLKIKDLPGSSLADRERRADE